MSEGTGMCQCGCGGKAPIAKQNHRRHGWVKGEPLRFIRGHATRKYHTAEERASAKLKQARAWATAHPERVWENQRAWAKGNRDRERAASRKYRQAHPERRRETMRQVRNRRRGAPLDAEAEAFAEILMADPCNYCGSREHLELEHITPLSQGGDSRWMNLATACRSCNAQKHADEPLGYLMRRSA